MHIIMPKDTLEQHKSLKKYFALLLNKIYEKQKSYWKKHTLMNTKTLYYTGKLYKVLL